jgi:hypothetical protein
MVGKDKKGNYICFEIIGNKTCKGLLWDSNSTLDYANIDKIAHNQGEYYIKCPECGKKHQMIYLTMGDGNPSKLKFIEYLED